MKAMTTTPVWAPARSTRIPAILRPPTRTSLGHLMVAWRPVQVATTSAVATAPRAVSQPHPNAVSGPPGARCAGGKSTIDIKIDDRGGAVHTLPRRPRPAVCSSASTTRPSLDAEAAARKARSLVLETRFHTAIRRPIERVDSPCSIWSGQSPMAGPTIGRTSVRMLLDPESKSNQGSQIVAHSADVGAQFAQRNVITTRGLETLQERDIQASRFGCRRQRHRLCLFF